MKPMTSLTFASVAAIIAGCAAAPPPELRDARAENERAVNGPAAELAPAELHAATDQLVVAERSFHDRGDDYRTRALAYAAERKARLAEVRAETLAAHRRRADAQADLGRMKDQALRTTSAELSNAQAALAVQGQALAQTERARLDAERRASRASNALTHIAVVHAEPRGMVITMPVSSLFDPGETTILPEARAKLDGIASVLSQQGADVSFDVDARTLAGDTDVSKKRAEAIRSYLMDRGVSGDRIRAEGLAPDGQNADVQIVVHAR